LRSIITVLGRKQNWSEGALFKVLSELYSIGREDFAAYLSCLSAQGIITSEVAAFNKKGHIIHYKLIALAANPPLLEGTSVQLNIARRLTSAEKRSARGKGAEKSETARPRRTSAPRGSKAKARREEDSPL
jgi:hypothetical protein